MPLPDHRVLHQVLGALLCTGLSACASIEHFRAEPRNACRGDTIAVTWEAQGCVRLAAAPELPGAGSQPSRGEASFAVDEDTRFTLTADGLFGEETAEADVVVAPPELTFGAVAECLPGRDGIRADFTLADQLGPGFRVASLSNVQGRPLAVRRGGRQTSLAPGSANDALRGEPARGHWTLTSPLAEGESCEDALRSIRQRLRIRIHLVCGGG